MSQIDKKEQVGTTVSNQTFHKSVLIIGGSGVVGSLTAKTLRQLHPELPITIGGRNLDKAKAVAQKIGYADAVQIDLSRRDLGLSAERTFGAMTIFLKDDTLNSLKYAQHKAIPYMNLSGALFELGPEVAHYVQKPDSTAILMNSFWLAGTCLLATLYFAKEFKKIHSIEIAALMDEKDMGGPATAVDFERLSKAGLYALILKDGKWVWATGKDESRYFKSVDGRKVKGNAYSAPLDVSSLAAATNAQSIRFDFALGETSSRRRGESFSCETIIEIEGEHNNGKKGHFRYELVHPAGQTPMTALGVATGIERLLGLEGGAPINPGLYYPEVIIDPAYMVKRLKEFGTDIKSVNE